MFRNTMALIVAAASIYSLSGIAVAQVQPTAAQMRMINQLPPAQREQALSALRQLQSPGQPGGTQSSISEPLTTKATKDPGADFSELLEPPKLKAAADSRLVIDLMPKLTLTALERRKIDEDRVLSRILGSHFYALDEFAVLRLPGLADIPLLGLNDEAIMQRLGAEPGLSIFDITAVLLDSQPIGVAALNPFGYEIFDPKGVGFEPVAAGPVPSDYVLGPGDSIRVQLFGNVNGIYEYEVARDGVLNLPELGPITVAGLPFSEFRKNLKNRVDKTLIGTQVSVSMGQLRTIRVLVLGDAKRPGSYVVGSLATISSVLYRSGGLSDIGSMRDIALKRQGKVVATLDLYDLLLKGDTSADSRLQSGDVIFVPPIGNTVSVAGAVRRPAIYELKGSTSIADAIRLAGGLLADAYTAKISLERISADRGRTVLSIDGDSTEGINVIVQAGDVLKIPYVLPELKETVTLAGQVERPGDFQWQPGMWLTDVIPSAAHLLAGADAHYVLIRRENNTDRTVQVISADLAAALQEPRGSEDVRLESRDTVHVFSLAYGRQRIIGPILEELELQAKSGAAYQEVRVGGRVRAPGTYPLEAGMRVSDLIRAGGQLDEAAYLLEAELTRYEMGNGQHREAELIKIDLTRVLNGDVAADLSIAAHDVLNIKAIPLWQEFEVVEIKGEVRFPGKYPIRRGEHLSSVLARAGGLTDMAFAEGAIFLREELRKREREQLEDLAERLEGEVAAAVGAQAGDVKSVAAREALLEKVKSTKATGRLVIDLPGILAGSTGNGADMVLDDGDQLLIPKHSQTVTIVGEVQFPTSHVYELDVDRDTYIGRSGGVTFNADKKRIYVVRANGSVVANRGSLFFRGRNQAEIRPGDTIVVPLDADRMSKLTFWTNVTSILYNVGIAAAAVASF